MKRIIAALIKSRFIMVLVTTARAVAVLACITWRNVPRMISICKSVGVAACFFAAVHYGAQFVNQTEEQLVREYYAAGARIAAHFGYVDPQTQTPAPAFNLSDNVAEFAAKDLIHPNLVWAVIDAEQSHGRCDIVSNKGAIGIMQVMPANVQFCAECGVRTRADLFDCRKNVCCGTRILKRHIASVNGAELLGVQAYNAGKNIDKSKESIGYGIRTRKFLAQRKARVAQEVLAKEVTTTNNEHRTKT